MSVVYALVARLQNVLCEHTEAGTTGNFATITRAVLQHLADEEAQQSKAKSVPTRSVFPYNQFNFFFLRERGLMFLCLAEEQVHANVAFLLLNEMKDMFLNKFGDKAQTALPYTMHAFDADLATLMKTYDNYKMDTQLSQVRQKMEKVKVVMIQNINQLMQRGEIIDMLVVRTDKIKQEACKYDRVTRDVKRKYWWKNVKYVIILILCVAVLAFLLTILICGIDFENCDRRLERKAKKLAKHLDQFKDDTLDKLDQWKDEQADKANDWKQGIEDKANDHLDKVGEAFDKTHVEDEEEDTTKKQTESSGSRSSHKALATPPT